MSLVIEFDPTLPIAARADEIADLVRNHQVVIVAGETGSGKTTQLPKICLSVGRERIAHTQPRRIAARSVAQRLCEEMATELGTEVGYQVRFTKQAGASTRVKVMTDGILLAELSHDRDLRRYDTIIIDEAHERSLNIDFLLGYLKQLLGRRPELKLIVTSATIDTARFAKHFDDAPVIEVSGRTYPVEVRYRPLDGQDQIEGVTEAVLELATEPGRRDILVFLSGEREIRDTAEAINALDADLEVVPLYARLSGADQHRVFEPHTRQRVVLATNIAETSITVPGIRYVVDAGVARISRYSARTKVQRLPTEPISQASANQRAGRCGRLGPGVAVRLYSEEDFDSRPEYTEPEILRTNLAMVLLQMARAGLGDIQSFPFVEAPPSAQITDGIRLLEELGALNPGRGRGSIRLTGIGHQLAQLPVDPRLGRMLVEAAGRDCLREVLVIVSGLAIPDIRERPSENPEAADILHRRFFCDQEDPAERKPETVGPKAHRLGKPSETGSLDKVVEGGDFAAMLRLWKYLRAQRKALSGNGFRRMCRAEYLNFIRIREWEDLHSQLKQICKDLGMGMTRVPAPMSEVLTSILSGLLSHVGLAEVNEQRPQRGRRQIREYLGARGARFAIQPGSALQRSTPPLVMAVELVETSRLWARTVAEITADQVEAVGGHALSSSISEPNWSQRSGRVMALEKVSLYGVPIIVGRRVDYARRDPVGAREIFLRRALVEGQWQTRHKFFAANQRLRAEAEELENRARRRDLLVDDQTIFDFYDARIPAEVNSSATFDKWWRGCDQTLLDMSLDDLMIADIDQGAFPDRWKVSGKEFRVSYVFDPGSGHDGVNVTLPVTVLNQVDGAEFSWQVPGLRQELATELIRGLPKAVRTRFVPAPEYAARALKWLRGQPRIAGEPFSQALGRALMGLTGELVDPGDWRPDDLPGHLLIGFTVMEGNKEVARGKSFDQLRQKLTARLNQTLTRVASRTSVTGATSWVFGELATQTVFGRGAARIVGYPAVNDEGASVGLSVVDTPQRQEQLHARGVRRLLVLTNPDPTRWVVSHLSNPDKLALGHSSYESVPKLLADARLKTVDRLARRIGIDVRDEQAYSKLADAVRADSAAEMLEVVKVVARVLAAQSRVVTELKGWPTGSSTRVDVEEQLANLTFTNFISATPDPWFARLPVYLEGIEVRIKAAGANPSRDLRLQGEVEQIEAEYADLLAGEPAGQLRAPVEEIAFLIEEFRISQYAQHLRTALPVSIRRIRTAISQALSQRIPA